MQYRQIVFLQGEEANVPLDLIEFHSVEESKKALNYLLEWEFGEGEITALEPWGRDDRRIDHKMDHKGDLTYVISYNRRLNYIGLTEVIRNYWDGK